MKACLKRTNVKIELLTEIDMVLIFEKRLRGGISQAIHRYATANNKYMPSYDSQQLSPFLMLNAKNEFEKHFFKLMNNSVFGKTMGNVRGRRDVKLIVTEKRRKKLVSKPNYDSCKQFTNDLMAIEMGKTEVLMDKPISVGQAILDISKILMYEFWYDYLKPKYQDKVKLCYMDTDSFIIHIETDDFFEDIANDVDECFDTSKYDKNDNRPLPIGKTKRR